MKKTKKRAFTLVELLVVIAILAVLATVSAVGYLGFTEKANQSVDEQMCTQYNTLLKAESALDDDITLPELITLIEENGINSNHFKTISKSYVFAYYREGKECLLLDKETGNILYPEDKKEISSEKLWSTLDSSLRLQKGVSNYALLSSVVVNSGLNFVSNDTITNYNFDLNNNAIEMNVKPTVNVNAENGTLILKESFDNVTSSEDVKIINKENNANGSWGSIISDKVPTNIFANTISVVDNTVTVKGKYFGSTHISEKGDSPSISVSNNSSSGLTNDNKLSNQTIVFEDCIFSNVGISLSGDAHFVIKNCTFYNVGKSRYPLTIFAQNTKTSYEIVGNTISDCVRSINIQLPYNKDGIVSRIENNTFNLNAIKTIKDEDKNNAIQIARNAYGTSENSGKLSINNNKVVEAKAFLTLHDGLVIGKGFTEDQINNYFNIIKNSLNITKGSNILSTNVSKIVKDPGVETTEIDTTLGKERTFYVNKLESMVNELLPLI